MRGHRTISQFTSDSDSPRFRDPGSIVAGLPTKHFCQSGHVMPAEAKVKRLSHSCRLLDKFPQKNGRTGEYNKYGKYRKGNVCDKNRRI